MTAALIERRWRPPEREGPGKRSLKPPPNPNQEAPPTERPDNSTEPGAFATAAVDLRQHGLFPLPIEGENHRTPRLKGFTRYRRKPPLEAVQRWADRFPTASAGIVCGRLSGITVIDVDSDDPAILYRVEERFGGAVIMVRTPRGGWHLYYRFASERCRNLRREGLLVDVKAQGGFVVAPPSVRMTGENAGKAYTFERGGWDDLPRLQPIKLGSLAPQIQLASDNPAPRQHLRAVHNGDVMGRNDTLFRVALRAAPQCGSELALMQYCIEANRFALPLDMEEVAKLVHSAWGYEERGENRIGNRDRQRRAGQLATLAAVEPDAEWLYRVVRRANSAADARGRWFPVSPAAMTIKAVIPGWSRRRYEHARDVLIRFGLLIKMRHGGRRQHHAHLFRFRKKGDPVPLLLVSSSDDADLVRVAHAINAGMSVRAAAAALNLSKSQAGRLGQRARDAGLLMERTVAPDQLSQNLVHKKEEADTAAAAPPPPDDSAPSEERKDAEPAPKQPNRRHPAKSAAEVTEVTKSSPVANDPGEGCLLNLPQPGGGHRMCGAPVGRDGIFCAEHGDGVGAQQSWRAPNNPARSGLPLRHGLIFSAPKGMMPRKRLTTGPVTQLTMGAGATWDNGAFL